MNILDDFTSGPETVAATFRGIHPDYTLLLELIIERVTLFESFQISQDFQIGYTGTSVQGWPNALSFTPRFENWRKTSSGPIGFIHSQPRRILRWKIFPAG